LTGYSTKKKKRVKTGEPGHPKNKRGRGHHFFSKQQGKGGQPTLNRKGQGSKSTEPAPVRNVPWRGGTVPTTGEDTRRGTTWRPCSAKKQETALGATESRPIQKAAHRWEGEKRKWGFGGEESRNLLFPRGSTKKNHGLGGGVNRKKEKEGLTGKGKKKTSPQRRPGIKDLGGPGKKGNAGGVSTNKGLGPQEKHQRTEKFLQRRRTKSSKIPPRKSQRGTRENNVAEHFFQHVFRKRGNRGVPGKKREKKNSALNLEKKHA